MASYFPFSIVTMNTALGIVTISTAIFALALLFYTLFINPPFKNDVDNSNNNNAIEESNDPVDITPSRLAANNLIHVPQNKEAIIDLKGFGLENNDYVPSEPVRSSREIEAELHLNLEQAIIDADTNGTIFQDSFIAPPSVASTNATTTSFLPSSSETTEATINFTEENETIEPKFEKILAFPECKKTEDGRRFC